VFQSKKHVMSGVKACRVLSFISIMLVVLIVYRACFTMLLCARSSDRCTQA
jgi:hypothetical protein